jgi:hypothetical protein
VNQLRVKGGVGLLVNTTLIRAIRTESAAALQHWFGVGAKASWNWRRRFVPSAGHVRTDGDRAAQLRASEKGAAAWRGVELSDEACDARSVAAKAAGRKYPNRWAHGDWTAAELALLGTAPDDVVAAQIGRTLGAVRGRRWKLNILRHRPAPVNG